LDAGIIRLVIVFAATGQQADKDHRQEYLFHKSLILGSAK
jgi:hypothetical protein